MKIKFGAIVTGWIEIENSQLAKMSCIIEDKIDKALDGLTVNGMILNNCSSTLITISDEPL